MGYVLQYHDPNTTPSPNPNERKSWEHCHIEFLLRIHVTKMLLGIYISLHSARNLFSGLRPRNLILKVLQSTQLPSPPPPPPAPFNKKMEWAVLYPKYI